MEAAGAQTLRSRLVYPAEGPPLDNGAVIVEGDRILDIFRWEQRASSPPAIDLGECILLPGFINSHCHLDYTAMSGRLSPAGGFTRWIEDIIRLKASWTLRNYLPSWIEGARRLERSGVTSVIDIEAVPRLLPEAWESTPLRVHSCLELMDITAPGRAARLVEEATQRCRELDSPAFPRCGLSPHAPYTTSDELYRLSARAVEDRLLTTHAAESAEEDILCREESGPFHLWMQERGTPWPTGRGTTLGLLERTGCLARKTLIAHVNYLAPGDETLLADRDVTVVHCPRSHRYFGHRPFPWQRLEQAGVNLALGTDSAASTPGEGAEALDFFGELSCLAGTGNAPDPIRILRWATVNGGRALGEKAGRIAPGWRADLIAIPSTTSPENAAEAIVHHQGPLLASMIGGRWIREPCPR